MEGLRKLRGTVKAKLTKFVRKIEIERNSGQPISKERIEVYIARADQIQDEFDDVQRKITASQTGEPTVSETTEEEEFEERYISLKVLLKEMLTRVTVQDHDEQQLGNTALARVLQQQADIMQKFVSNGVCGDSGGSQGYSTSNEAIAELVAQQTELLRRFTNAGGVVRNESNVKLPVVNLPTFDGRIEEWKRFSETFQSLIHSNNNIPLIQKFQYLITSLSDSASKIVESIELTNENYEVAWSLLKKRYDDPRAIKKKHIQCLFNMPRVEKESSGALRELIDYTLKHLRILKSMELPTDSWHELIIHMIEAKLDITTLRAWEQSGKAGDAGLNTLTEFLESRCQALERIEARSKQKDVSTKSEAENHQSKFRSKGKKEQSEKSTTLATSVTSVKCFLCDEEHLLYRCEKFLAMPVEARFKEVQRLKLCINCLRNDHFLKACKMGACKICSDRHNTLLHRPNEGERCIAKSPERASNSKASANVAVHHAANSTKRQHVIMATAVVNAARANGANTAIRILLDSASEANFVTQAACNRLGVKRNKTSEIVTGLNEMQSEISQSCDVTIQSRYSSYKVNVHCFIVPTITKSLPSVQIDKNAVQIPTNVKLADIEFHTPSAIDMLVGAEFFFDLLETEKIELGENLPVLKNTKLGWVIAGSIALNRITNLACVRSTIANFHCSIDAWETLNKNLERFWEIENVHDEANRELSADERQCEEFFDQTIQRDENGRFVVRLPFRKAPSLLGRSREIAIRRFAQLERRLEKNAKLKERYTEFMREYQELGHMSPVDSVEQENGKVIVYLPHHGVIKEASTSTKLRTVFDASSKTDSGVSLNDVLHVGPPLQSSLIDIVIRFRFYNIALTGDLCKMYRQITVHVNDRDYQRILWRESPSKHVQEFQLNTVTYGQASSAYLAIKSVRRLAESSINKYPIAARFVLDSMYVDDIMAGASDVQGVIEVQQQLTALLQAGGFEIHKWCSNCPEGLVYVPEERRAGVATRSIDSTETIKTLGLEWGPHDDNFRFSVQQIEAATTKRQVLSAISKLFDPLGLIGPILTSAKLLMQETWRMDCNWDEPLPTTMVEKWETFRRNLNNVNTLLIPRRVVACDKPARLFLQGFCDASENAYGACVYIQAEDENGALTARLLCSKARVAPIKTTSIPRLELCSAVLLARLIASVQRGLRVPINGLQAWSDSTVALCWIRGDVARWKTFVANRVSEIIQAIPAKCWDHVRGEENPADLISRGTSPSDLQSSELWWAGPSWLKEKQPTNKENINHEPSMEITEIIETEERKITPKCNFSSGKSSILQEIIDRFSSLTKIERVLAYCLRFISNLKRRSAERVLGRLSVTELHESHQRLVKHTQAIQFGEEIIALKNNGNLKASSKLIQLHPFFDHNGVIRVGGRLQHAALPFEQKHPIILPAGTRFSRLLFERAHQRLLHASQLLLLSSIKEKYWPLKGRDLARQICHSCVCCSRNKPRDSSQIMGSLPSDRVKPSRAFTVTGIDFAGPITTLVNKGRGRKTNKSYIAVFICYSTKAIHLEATTELTSAAFLAALRRFISRRGRPRTICSDNGTNFVGANREMKEIYAFVRSQVQETIGDLFTNENIEWRFIPPGSPHMGGLWEAGVKSCKYHLRRIMGNTLFTFEELATALAQVEACLNSRPLSAMSSDSNDLQPLTPAHFLVGESLTGLPEVALDEIPMNRLNRWQLIQRTTQDFWKRWAAEYLNTLQGRSKWKTERTNLQLNDLVTVKDENLPPLKWKLGRIVELHPGQDGLVRVVTIRTAGGNIKRAISKLCKLPVASEEN